MTSGYSETFRGTGIRVTFSIYHVVVNTLKSDDKFNFILDLSISICGLNTSLPSCLHPRPINPVFYRRSMTKSLFKRSFKLRCFQFLSFAA